MSIKSIKGSLAYITLDKNLSDIRKLIIFKTNPNFSEFFVGINKDRDTLRRAGIVLLVTAFETFVEDKLRNSFKKRINNISNPGQIPTMFKNIIFPGFMEIK